MSTLFNESYDVIIVGGGLAGCVAAQYAAKNGARTIILERDEKVGTPVRCGEGVSERGIKSFVPLDGPWIANKLSSVDFIAPNGNKITLATNLIGYILDRTIFDKYLGDKAVQKGAKLVTNADVTGLIEENGHYTGVKVTHNKKSFGVKGAVVIGADGIESRVGRWAGLKTMTKLNNMESAVQVLATNISVKADSIGLYFGKDVAPGGYAWVFPKNDVSANVGLAISGNHARERSAESYLKEFLQKNFPAGSFTSMTAGGVPCNPPLKKMSIKNVLVAGDAGHTVNPVSGAGIATALASGKIAGELAAEAVKDKKNIENTLKLFTKKWFRSRGRDMKRFNRLKEFVIKLSDEQLNDLASLIKEIPQSEWSMLKIIMFAVRNRPDLIIDAIKVYKDF